MIAEVLLDVVLGLFWGPADDFGHIDVRLIAVVTTVVIAVTEFCARDASRIIWTENWRIIKRASCKLIR